MEAAFGASVDDKQSTEETFLVKGAQLRVCSNTFCHFSRITTCRISRVQLMQSAHWRCDKSSRQNFPSPQCLKEYRQLYKSTHPNRQLYKLTHPNRQLYKSAHPNRQLYILTHPNRQLYKLTHPNRQLYKSTHPNRQLYKSAHPNTHL